MLANQDKIALYREMVMIRRFEEAAGEMYERGDIRGFLHLYIGQEAVATGFMWPLRADDYVIGAYREHAHALSRCASPRAVMAELFGKSTGVSRGKGGSMHLFDLNRKFLGGTAIVGGGLPLATGIAFSINYRGGDQVCICFFGDGAVNEGSFHEALNIASLWNLPILFVCENNLYGMGTHVSRASAVPNLYKRATCYAMEVRSVDGMDIMAVCETAESAMDSVRNDKRPVFVEATTYRFRGHSTADPGAYRTKEEIEEWRLRDPIVTFGQRLLQDKVLTLEDVERIQEEIEVEIADAVEFAEQSPLPEPDALWKDVYA